MSEGRTAARAWALAREAAVLDLNRWGLDPASIRRALRGEKEDEGPPVPTLAAFADTFIGHAKANKQKASTIYAKQSILRAHLVPALGAKRLDAISDVDVHALKVRLAEHRPKTVNNVLAVLSRRLRVAKRLKVIGAVPGAVPAETMELLKVSPAAVVPFYTFEEYRALAAAAERLDPRILAAVTSGRRRRPPCWRGVGAGAGGRQQGEFPRSRRAAGMVRRRGHPKGGRGRSVPMTEKLAAALSVVRHLRGDRLLVLDDGSALTAKVLRGWMKSAQRLAGHKVTGNFHVLRHTFCSHLAMRGAPARVIQELAGHAHLATTMRYVHLEPGHKEQGIRLLDGRPAAPVSEVRGGRMEAEAL